MSFYKSLIPVIMFDYIYNTPLSSSSNKVIDHGVAFYRELTFDT